MSIVARTAPLRRRLQAEKPADPPPRRPRVKLPRVAEVPADFPTAVPPAAPQAAALTRTPLPIGDTSLAAALASVRWLLGRGGYPAPHVELIADHLGRGGDVADCPGLLDVDRGPVQDLIDRRTGRVEAS